MKERLDIWMLRHEKELLVLVEDARRKKGALERVLARAKRDSEDLGG